LTPAASAAGTARSRKLLSEIAAGALGCQRTVITFCFSPAPASWEKNVAPPSAAYLPVSSLAPKSTAEAVAAKVSAHRSASAAVSVFKLPVPFSEVPSGAAPRSSAGR
jgi:hypothetical protein